MILIALSIYSLKTVHTKMKIGQKKGNESKRDELYLHAQKANKQTRMRTEMHAKDAQIKYLQHFIRTSVTG